MGHVSEYERGVREPPLYVLLQYSRAAGILIEWLIDDEIELPEDLPAGPLPGGGGGDGISGPSSKSAIPAPV